MCLHGALCSIHFEFDMQHNHGGRGSVGKIFNTTLLHL